MTSIFCEQSGLNDESDNVCRNAQLQYNEGNKNPHVHYYTEQPSRETHDNTGLCFSEPIISTTNVKTEDLEKIYVKEEVIDQKIESCEGMQDTTQAFTPKLEQELPFLLPASEANSGKCNVKNLTKASLQSIMCDEKIRIIKTIGKGGKKVLQCGICKHTTPWNCLMKEHVRQHSGDLLQCENCEYRTAHSRDLRAHMQRHSDVVMQCEYCEFRTTRTFGMKIHMRRHNGGMLHCEHCEYRASKGDHMKTHMRRHTGDLLSCEHCTYRTPQISHLKAHMRRHTDNWMQCEHCEYRTVYKRDLNRHMHRHDGQLLQI